MRREDGNRRMNIKILNTISMVRIQVKTEENKPNEYIILDQEIPLESILEQIIEIGDEEQDPKRLIYSRNPDHTQNPYGSLEHLNRRQRGRPKGSNNKNKKSVQNVIRTNKEHKKQRGRPKGAKNKNKQTEVSQKLTRHGKVDPTMVRVTIQPRVYDRNAYFVISTTERECPLCRRRFGRSTIQNRPLVHPIICKCGLLLLNYTPK